MLYPKIIVAMQSNEKIQKSSFSWQHWKHGASDLTIISTQCHCSIIHHQSWMWWQGD